MECIASRLVAGKAGTEEFGFFSGSAAAWEAVAWAK